ncbi:MAG: prepilin-type N-terminal cleavage/methylation domain-containing protein [Phycisphaeraceae bacterium]|nr:prepilin-type N-terminal cleavage/methylation domain-containing protein [Phycisphaerae bacterium]MBX3391304.1 prepilin-type N-terminal cleavage/methylation domain-containing protein [Phycisphaeraceae bacterium]
MKDTQASVRGAAPVRMRSAASWARGRGFTLIQLLVTLAVVGTLSGILLTAMSLARRSAIRGADTQVMGAITTGMTAFSATFDFAPPLVRDQHVSTPRTIVKTMVDSVEVSSIAVYTPASDGNFLRGSNLNISMSNPLAVNDRRFSVNSLGVYLAGVMSAPRRSSVAEVPVDLVPGPGTGRPTLSGGFEKGRFGPFIDVGGRTLTVARNDDPDFPTVIVQDRNQVPVRYYRWLKNQSVTTWDDLNIPPMVIGPDYPKFHSSTSASQREQADPRITGANWACVMAGPNRVFGDEPIDVIVQALRGYEGASVDESMSEAALRARAWADNLVEVGRAAN